MEETGGASAYGASLAGGGFDFYKFIRQPQTIVRLLSWVSGDSTCVCRCFFHVQSSNEAEIISNTVCEQVRLARRLRGARNDLFFHALWPEQQATMCCVSTGRHVACSWCMTAARRQHRSTLLLSEDKRQKTVRHSEKGQESKQQLN